MDLLIRKAFWVCLDKKVGSCVWGHILGVIFFQSLLEEQNGSKGIICQEGIFIFLLMYAWCH